MKLMKRKPRDSSLLERELELMKTDEFARTNSLLVELCDTRLEAVVKTSLNLVRYSLKTDSSFFNTISTVIVAPFLPLVLFPYYGKPVNKDLLTGKYIRRYFEIL